MSRADTEPYRLPDFARLTDDHDGQAADPLGDPLRLLAALEVLRLELGALLLEARQVVLAGAQRLLLRQQEVAGEAGLHLHHVAHLSELFDTLEQDQFHIGHDALPQLTM